MKKGATFLAVRGSARGTEDATGCQTGLGGHHSPESGRRPLAPGPDTTPSRDSQAGNVTQISPELPRQKAPQATALLSTEPGIL